MRQARSREPASVRGSVAASDANGLATVYVDIESGQDAFMITASSESCRLEEIHDPLGNLVLTWATGTTSLTEAVFADYRDVSNWPIRREDGPSSRAHASGLRDGGQRRNLRGQARCHGPAPNGRRPHDRYRAGAGVLLRRRARPGARRRCRGELPALERSLGAIRLEPRVDNG